MNQKRRQEIGSRIEEIRTTTLRGMSQVKLGKSIGTTGQNIGLIIKGNGSMSLEKAIEFCEFAGVSMDYVFRGRKNNIDVAHVTEALNKYNESS